MRGLRFLLKQPRVIFLIIIRVYQKTLSFDHGIMKLFYPEGFCRFHPTCSEYGYKCIQRHGIIRGGWLTTKRVLKCNPFHLGGVDEPPK